MAGMLSPAARERIRAANDIVDVIGSYLPLKRAGANFTALCPFHKEKSPSFNVNPSRQIFHCFGCHKGGDVFTFVQDYENIGFMDAVRRLAERAKIPLEFDDAPGAQESRHLKDQLLDIHEQLTQRWQNCLANEAAGQLARDYLVRRGVSPEAIKLFRLGAAPEAWDDTVNWAHSKKFELATVEKAGLIIHKEDTGRYYDRFRGRLMFPICDEQGRVVGFSGRVLAGDEKTAKYVNSPETPIFTKSKIFFGLDKSKRAILDAGCAIICEGQLDLIACYMNGVQNMVAPQGTAFTEQHARILKRYANEVVLCFDSDNAGQNAAVRALDHLLAAGLAVRVAVVPAPHDPDSFIKANGGPAFQQIVNGASGFFDYYLGRLCATNDVNSDKGRLAVLRAMSEAVHKTGNVVLIDTYAQKTALRLGVAPESVRAEFRKNPAPAAATYEAEDESFENAEAPEAATPPSPTELHLLKMLLRHDHLAAWAGSYLDRQWITHGLIRQIVGRRLAAHEQGTWHSLAEFLDACESPAERSLITEAAAGDREIPNLETQLADVTLKLRNQFLEHQIAALIQRLSQPEMPDTERMQLLQQQQQLKAQKRAPLAPRQS
jgi:DNA primase